MEKDFLKSAGVKTGKDYLELAKSKIGGLGQASHLDIATLYALISIAESLKTLADTVKCQNDQA